MGEPQDVSDRRTRRCRSSIEGINGQRQSGLPRLARDQILAFTGDQSCGVVNAASLRKRAEAVRFQELWLALAPALQKVAEKGLMSYHINQNIEQLPFWQVWMQEPEAAQWMRSCLEERGFTV